MNSAWYLSFYSEAELPAERFLFLYFESFGTVPF
jgi:hypothetical protein